MVVASGAEFNQLAKHHGCPRPNSRPHYKEELTGSFDIPDEYEVADPLEDIHFDGQTLRFSVAGHNGFWESVFASDGNSLTGNWSEWGVQSPLTFIRDAVTGATKLSSSVRTTKRASK